MVKNMTRGIKGCALLLSFLPIVLLIAADQPKVQTEYKSTALIELPRDGSRMLTSVVDRTNGKLIGEVTAQTALASKTADYKQLGPGAET
jgi:hypothetical protein